MRYQIILLLLVFSVSEAFALNVTMSTKIQGGDKPIVVGKTNLPDGTDLMVSIERNKSAYGGQSKVKVSRGEFRAGPFTQKGSAFNPGTYTLKITVPFAPTQPSSVQSVIGDHGQELQGSLVKRGALGKFAEYHSTFKVAGAVSAIKDKMARQQDMKDRHEWWIKNCKDICTASQVQSGDITNFDWERCYNKCLAEEKKK
ncbi:MAG TPA: hypothetical protein VFG19_00755 [Geobacteraceae bacterium]|nr:hypothetical protein [Geobacteraceae bacterium]